MDNIEELIHAKDITQYLVDNKEVSIIDFLRKPLFVQESASLEKVLIQLQESSSHLVFIAYCA